MEKRLPAVWSCCFVSWTKDDHMGPYSFGNCLCICTSPSTTGLTPAWSLLYYKIILKNPLPLVWCVFFFLLFLIAMQAFRGKWSRIWMLNACIATRGPSSTWMLSVLLQPPFRPSTHLPGAMHGMVATALLWTQAGGSMPSPLSSFPLPHATLCYGIFWHVCICCMDLGNWRCWAVEGWQELPWRPSFLLMPRPLSLHGKARWHRDSGCWDLHWTSTPLEYLPEQSEFPERTSEKAGSSWCA